MSNIRTMVREFILTQCLPGEPPGHLQDDAPLPTSGTLDSLRLLHLVSEIERAAGFEIEAHEVDDDNFRSVDHVVAFVEQRQATR